MRRQAIKTTLQDIQRFRALFLQETNTQIRYDACHARGWSDSYLLALDDLAVGYGSIKGQQRHGRDTVFEFYVVPPFRRWSRPLFAELIASARATHIECQSNDFALTTLFHECARDVTADVVLFKDHVVTQQLVAGGAVRPRREGEQVFEHTDEPVGEYVLEVAGEIVATAGFMLHYNMPFADLYMETRPDRRRRGYGSYIVQEVKKACYLAGRVPAARTSVDNVASRATLSRAGLRECGFMLNGKVKEAISSGGWLTAEDV